MATDALSAGTQPTGLHNTLSGTTADTVTVTPTRNGCWVEVFNRDTTEPLYVRADGTTAVAAADGTVYIPAEGSFPWKLSGRTAVAISIVGNGNAYSVHAVDLLD